jgi:hypothetical protein
MQRSGTEHLVLMEIGRGGFPPLPAKPFEQPSVPPKEPHMAVSFATTQDKVEALYVGYFARAADPAGLNYWMNQINSGSTSYAQAAASFSVQQEATAAYPYLADPSTGDAGTFIDQVYTSLFNHTADAAGKAYWQNQLAAANNSPAAVGAFILNVISGAQGSDADAVMNKVAVASYFTNGLSDSGRPYDAAADSEGRSEVTTTDSTSSSVTMNQARSDSFEATGVPTSTGTPTPQNFTLTTGSDNFTGGGGNDTFTGTYSDGGTNTFNPTDMLRGIGGSDTLFITPSIGTAATTLADGLWSNVSTTENVSVTTNGGAIGITTGAAFQAAFGLGGISLTTNTTGGAVNVDMTTFTGAETISVSSGAGAVAIGTGSGVGNVAVNTTSGAITVHGTGLAGISTSSSGAGALTIGDAIGGGADLVSVTVTNSGAGAQTINSTAPGTVNVNATANGGLQTITTGAGNDNIAIGSSASLALLNGSGGADTFTLGSTHSGVNAITVSFGESVQTAKDVIVNFGMSATVSDTLAFGTTTVLTEAQLGGGFTVVNGIATQVGSTLATFLAAATTSATLGVVAYRSGADTYVVASDGLASGNVDSVVDLVGVVTATSVGTTAGVGQIHIV